MEDLMRDPEMKQVIKTPSAISGEGSLESDKECGTRAQMPSQHRSEMRYNMMFPSPPMNRPVLVKVGRKLGSRR